MRAGYDETGSGDFYAGAEYPKAEEEPEPLHREARSPPVSPERLFTRLRRPAGSGVYKAPGTPGGRRNPPRRRSRPPRCQAEKSHAFLRGPSRSRCASVFWRRWAVSLILVYISFGFSAGLPLAGAMSNVRVAALFSLVAELCVMMLGLDVLTHGLNGPLAPQPERRKPGCRLLRRRGFRRRIYGDRRRCLARAPFLRPFRPLSMTFALWGGHLGCRGFRASFKALALGKNPFAVTLVREAENAYLIKTRRGPDGFRAPQRGNPIPARSSWPSARPSCSSPRWSSLCLPPWRGGRPGDFFHVLAGACRGLHAFFPCSSAIRCSFPLPRGACCRTGAAIAGWAGARDNRKGPAPWWVTDSDLFPPSTLSLGSIRVLEGIYTDKVISYTGSLIAASGSALAPLFAELMRRHGCTLQRVDDFTVSEGGIRAFIRGEEVAVGSSGFMHLCGVRLPQKLSAKNAVFTAIGGSLVGVFSVSYSALPSVQDALVTLFHGRRAPIFAIRDFNVDPLLVRQKFKMATDSFEFPSFAERYRISGADPDPESAVAAVLARDGLAPLVEIAERGLRLYRATRLCAVLTLVSACIGLLLLFLLCWRAAYDSVTAGNVLLYLSFWLVPVVVTAFGVRR